MSSDLSQFSFWSLKLPHSLSIFFPASFCCDCVEKLSELSVCIRLHLSPFLACICNQIFESPTGHEDDLTVFLISCPSQQPSSSITHPPLTASFLASWANVQMTFRNYECCWPPRGHRDTEIAERKIKMDGDALIGNCRIEHIHIIIWIILNFPNGEDCLL